MGKVKPLLDQFPCFHSWSRIFHDNELHISSGVSLEKLTINFRVFLHAGYISIYMQTILLHKKQRNSTCASQLFPEANISNFSRRLDCLLWTNTEVDLAVKPYMLLWNKWISPSIHVYAELWSTTQYNIDASIPRIWSFCTLRYISPLLQYFHSSSVLNTGKHKKMQGVYMHEGYITIHMQTAFPHSKLRNSVCAS